jgi:diguanylate cyclase (GGDEF)-like protein
MKKRNGSGSRRLVEMTSKFQKSQHVLLQTLHEKGMIAATELSRMTTAVERAVAQKRSSDVLSTAVLIHNRVIQALDESVEDAPEKREAQEIEALIQLSAVLHSNADDREVCQKALDILQKVIPFESGTVFLFDNEDARLDPVAIKGQRVDLIDRVQFDLGLGLSAWVAKKKKPILITELARGHRPGEPDICSFVSNPMIVQGELVGVINLSHPEARKFDEDDLRLLRLFGGQLVSALERTLHRREVKRQSVRDRLTGLYNRRHFQERLTVELERAHRNYQPVSLLYLDVDEFESFNQRYGYQAGDRVLTDIAKVLQKTCRAADLIARHGGEEFVVLLPSTSAEEAEVAGERIRKAIETHVFPQKRKITVSLGAAAYPEDADGHLDLVAKAEQALFMAKKSGPNRSMTFQALAVH